MCKLANIARIHKVINRSLFTITGKLDYDRITDAFILLANTVHEYKGDRENMWYIGEYSESDLAESIIGAYWHYTEWHNGQWSKSYVALSALGQVFSPGMSSAEPENSTYQSLNDIAESS